MARQIISAISAFVQEDGGQRLVIPMGAFDQSAHDRRVMDNISIYQALSGFGRYNALGRIYHGMGSESWYLVQLEPATATNAAYPLAFIANVISHVLSHGHFLSDEQAAEIPSLRALQLAWKAAGAAYNDTLSPDEGWQGGMEGWAEEFDQVWGRYSRREGLIALNHTTGSGRMHVRVSDDGSSQYCELSFYAGPAQEGGEGRLAAKVVFSPSLVEDPGAYLSVEVNEELLKGRYDRVSLLWEIDERLGGFISAGLKYLANSPEGYFGQKGAKALMAAKAELEAWQQANSAV